ncbi:MAG: leucine-rich repeat protein [Oscillospiraceae bacterium]|nr:leucine-rich repeat protein [Oscillospiraceae bacterium]
MKTATRGKKLLSLCLALVLVLALLPGSVFAVNYLGSGDCGMYGGDLRYTLDSDGHLSFQGSGQMANYSAAYPAPWYQYRLQIKNITFQEGVTSVGSYAFKDCEALAYVQLPSTLTSIGSYAFAGCSSLPDIAIPSWLTSIGSYAFKDCTSLGTGYSGYVSIPSGVSYIPDGLFSGCSSLSYVGISGAVMIGSEAFKGCIGLQSLMIPATVTNIGSSAFQNCVSLEELAIPSGVKVLGDNVFAGCNHLSRLSLPAGLTTIGNYAFSGCTALTALAIPAGVTAIGSYAFNRCTGLLELTLPAGLVQMGSFAFSDCTSLRTATIPEGVTAISESAFSNCVSLATLRLPVSMRTVAVNAFLGCGNIAVYYAGTREAWAAISIASGNNALVYAGIHSGDDPELPKIPVMVSATATPGKVTVTWQAAADAQRYQVLRKTGSGAWQVVNETTKLQFVDINIVGGGVYSYTVRAYTIYGWGEYDPVGVKATAIAAIPLSIAAVTADATAAGIGQTITWTAAGQGNTGTLEYIFSINKDGSRVKLGTYSTSNTYSYTPTETGTYTATVYVRYRENTAETASLTGGAVTVTNTAPAVPVLVSATAAPGQITVKWNQVSEAAKYAVYRKAAGAAGWTRLTNTCTSPSYTDKSTDLKAGTTYYYTVRAYVGGAWGGYNSTGVSAKAVAAASTVPVLVSAVAAPGQITVRWNQVSGATKYAVYRKAAGAAGWTRLTNTCTSPSYTDKSTDLKAGTTYYYTVRANVGGTWSGYDSIGVSAKAVAAASTVPVLVSAAAAPGQITVKWNQVSGATKYAVYRKAAGATSWTRLTNTVTGTSYIDKSTDLVAGTTYYYTVRAYLNGAWSGYDSTGVSAKTVDSGLTITSVTAGFTYTAGIPRINCAAAASGGTGTVQYRFDIYKDGALIQGGSYGTSKTYIYLPTAAGTYTVMAYVKDASGAAASKMSLAVLVP